MHKFLSRRRWNYPPTGQTIIGTMGLWSGRSRGFYGCPWDLCRKWPPLDPHGYWPASYNGYHWCQEIRKVSKVPIMFLSSRDQAMDIVMAINMGGDDFVTKPFDKMSSLPRSKGSYAAPTNLGQIKSAGAPRSHPQSQVHGLGVWRGSHQADQEWISDPARPVWACRAVSWHAMTWWRSSGIATSIDDNTLSVNVARLRKKLEEAGLPNFIETKKGIGYGLTPWINLEWSSGSTWNPQAPTLIYWSSFDRRLGLCLSLSRDGGRFSLYATLVLGLLPSVSWSGISPWPFETTAKPHLWGSMRLYQPLEQLPLGKSTRKNSRRVWGREDSPGQVQWPDGITIPSGFTSD